MNRVIKTLILGLLVSFNLQAIPYFPFEWILTISILLMILFLNSERLSIFLSMLLFMFPIIYHSNELAILYFIAGLSFILVFNKSSKFAEIFFLIFSIPLFSTHNFFGVFIPFEFIIVPLVPLLLEKENILVVILIYLFYSIIKIINQENVIGYVIVNLPNYSFYTLAPYPAVFYNLNWIADKFHPFIDLIKLKNILLNIGKAFLNNSTIILQMVFWGIAAYVIKYFQGLKKKLYFFVGYLIGLMLMFSFYFLILLIDAEKIKYSLKILYPSLAVIYLVICIAGLLRKYTISDLYYITFNRSKPKQNKKPQPSFSVKVSPSFLQKQREEEKKYEKKVAINKLDLDNLTLEELVKISVHLNEYIEKKFSVVRTFLGIDIFKSSKLKESESEDNVQFSFEQFHRFIDTTVSAFGATLLNRSGDGVIYSFEKADRGVYAAKSILIRLRVFNQKINKLGKPFQVRIGINTGRVVKGESKEGGRMFSRVLDITGHLLKLAHQDQVLICEDTYKILEEKVLLRKVFFSEEDRIDVYTLKE